MYSIQQLILTLNRASHPLIRSILWLMLVSVGALGDAFAEDLNGTPRVHPAVLEAAASGKSIDVIVILKDQPQSTLTDSIRRKYAPRLKELGGQVRAHHQALQPTAVIAKKADELWQATQLMKESSPNASDPSLPLLQEMDALRDQRRTDVGEAISTATQQSQAAMVDRVQRLGGSVSRSTRVLNAVAATLPAPALAVLQQDSAVAEIIADQGLQPDLDATTVSLGANTWWAAGFNGSPYDVGILDSGVYQHSYLGGHTLYDNFDHTLGIPRHGEGYLFHGTAVACVYASNDPSLQGVTYGVDAILSDSCSPVSAAMNGADWMVLDAPQAPEVINHSCGSDNAVSEDWSSSARHIDGLVRDFDVTVAKSAGNEGWGWASITHPAETYNGVTVAAIETFGTVTRDDDVIAGYSSRGPTLDGRKKPDIAAPGNVRTCALRNGVADVQGTSFAAPHLGAAALLLENGGNHDPMSIKAVLINTADSWEDFDTPGSYDDLQVNRKEWNRSYGWGYLNLLHAYHHREDYFVSSLWPGPALWPGVGNQRYRLYTGPGHVGDKATLVWEKHAIPCNGSTIPAISNLDLYLYEEESGVLRDSDASELDNVHQVAVTAEGPRVIKVSTDSPSFQCDEEPFALATEEKWGEAEGPGFEIDLSAPATLARNQKFTLTAEISNDGDLDAHDVAVVLSLPKGFGLIKGETSVDLGRIGKGETRRIDWNAQVLSPLASSATASVRVNSNSYDETFAGSARKSFRIF